MYLPFDCWILHKSVITLTNNNPLKLPVCSSYRINDRAARTIGRQLAVIGDRLDWDRASRRPNWLRTPLHMLRPAQALTRTIYRYKNYYHSLYYYSLISSFYSLLLSKCGCSLSLSLRDLQNQFGGFQSLSAAVKAWIAASVPGQGIHRADAWAAWVTIMVLSYFLEFSSKCNVNIVYVWLTISCLLSQVANLQPETCTGWTRGLLVTVALVTICTALWVEWKG